MLYWMLYISWFHFHSSLGGRWWYSYFRNYWGFERDKQAVIGRAKLRTQKNPALDNQVFFCYPMLALFLRSETLVFLSPLSHWFPPPSFYSFFYIKLYFLRHSFSEYLLSVSCVPGTALKYSSELNSFLFCSLHSSEGKQINKWICEEK